MYTIHRILGCILGLLLLGAGTLQAQALRGQISLQMAGSTIENSVGPGLHFDGKLPLVAGLSAVGGAGLSAFILEGRSDGTYSFTPEVGLNYVMPSRSKGATTIFGGGGYHVPFGTGASISQGGPTIHLGTGRIRTLQESTLFVNLSPTLVIRRETTSYLIALRTGVVF